ncbi:G-type lectin S-receptor-like serine/threonine-protein kinase [Tanacetum coccineum]|uniref:Receptor-like serine/threonine-protein kinase n=1 Tax=Tanacetum coccineum TaxID=301880 RepID=A0ABQ5DKZ6_9ASTR
MGILLILFLAPTLSFSSGIDTISTNNSLSGDGTIVSKGETFELGFFKAGNSFNYYIGIWYKKLYTSPRTIVWVANREAPISDRFSSELKLLNGNLVLLNESKLPVWSTNVTSTSGLNSAVAVILDDGNLVLTDDGLNSAEPLWQSFDHPVNTWLPGAKLAYDKRRNKSVPLTSWKSTEDPASGLYSLELHPVRLMVALKWNDSIQYWDTGSWDPLQANSFYKYNYTRNEKENYFNYSAYNPSVTSRFTMDVSGQFQLHTWSESIKAWNIIWAQPENQCQVYALCGNFGTCRQTGLSLCNCLTGFQPRSQSDWNRSDFSGGCVRKTSFTCSGNEEKPDFLTIKVMSLPPNNSVAIGSVGECRTTCLNDCSCNAYSYVDNGCSFWSGELLNLSEDNFNGKTIYIKVASKDLASPKKNNTITISIVIGSVGSGILVIGLLVFINYRRKRMLAGKTSMEGSLVAFSYRDLQLATKNFSEKLGGGGFGSVFKGVLRDSSIVAVKKLESINQGEKQFRSEVSTIGTIQHVNLVRLCGFCAEGNDKLLVYDYMPNGSLHSHLFHEKQENVLNWKTRYEIALGTARGLVYLHEKCRDCIIHCDIKPENILLDGDFHPKVADFGLAKLVGREFSRVLTSMRGTRGYLAPEWLSGVAVTAKADVFSYGMMLFELVHGKRNTEGFEDSDFTFFPSLAANVYMAGGDILSLLDSRLNREASVDEVTKIFKVAYWCIQDQEECRPSMSLVEQILEGVSDVSMPPIPKYVNFFVDKTEHDDHFFTKISSNGHSQSNFPNVDSLSESASSS